MQRRVRRILLVTSPYDSFIMSEEGHLHEALLSQFFDLNLTTPDIVRVSNGAEALTVLEEDRDFDLVVSSLKIAEGNAAEGLGSDRGAPITVSDGYSI